MVRYELKFAFSDDMYDYLLHTIKNHPAFFSEIFYQRQINNIYFDTINFKHYWENTNGTGTREKYRIRWYGDTFRSINLPILEIKRKFGLVGDKISERCPSFELTNDFSWFDYAHEINNYTSDIDNVESIMHLKNLVSQNPVIINNYQRRYFLTADKRIRLTIDSGINYLKISPNYVASNYTEDRKIIVEIKFDKDCALEAEKVTNNFNWRLARNSKYVNGVDLLYSSN